MKRRIILGSLLVVGTLSIAVAQQAPQPSAEALMVTKLKDNLYVLKGGGGNTSVFVTGTGVVVVDSKNPGWGQPILDKIKTLTDKPVTTLINTHTHGDHVSGNVSFPATVEIVVQTNTAENMKKMIPNSTAADQTVPAQTIFQQNGGKGMPKRTFKDKMTIGKGADEVDLFYFGRGHTNGDAWVLFPANRVLHAADIFSGKNIPLLDANNGGSAVEIANSLEKAANSLNGKYDTIVTGHSSEMTPADLREYVQFNRDFVTDVQTSMKGGKTPADVAASWKIPAKYNGYAPIATDGDRNRVRNNAALAFKELGAKGTK
ncbi:MAG TPA: MBL fold metallo-hydrolase [Vicinamibacterales bacterium]|jgi:glyoxylase-like metal-dependent hydrolase (beta-lactamase superfamily II)